MSDARSVIDRDVSRPLMGRDERERFDRIVVAHLADALTIATWLTGSRADGEDVVQDACLRALQALSTYAGGSARAWTLAIVRNCAFAWLRKNRRAGLVALDDLSVDELAQVERGGDLQASLANTPEADFIAGAEAGLLKAAIEALPPEFREVLVLRDVQGLTYREIAQIAAVPLGTVMSRLARARCRVVAAVAAASEEERPVLQPRETGERPAETRSQSSRARRALGSASSSAR